MTTELAKALPDNPVNLWFLLLFVVIFGGVVAWSLRPARRKDLEETSKQPLHD